MDIINRLSSALIIYDQDDPLENKRIIPAQLSEADKIVNETIDYYRNTQQNERDKIHKLITEKIALFLLHFGIRMATYSLRLSSQRYFTNGLLAISLTLNTLDERDLLIVLPLYCDAQNKNSLSFDEVLKQDNKFSLVLKRFIDRDEEDKSLNCMGWTLGFDDNHNLTYLIK